MTERNIRLTQPDHPPSDSDLAAWLGNKAYKSWQQVVQMIEQNYRGVFIPEWLFGGKKHGWSLRYKKSKSFCTLIPEKNRFALLIVFGAAQRAKVKTIKDSLLPDTQNAYDSAATYHDGKWLLLTVNSNKVVQDVLVLLAVKRKPKGAAHRSMPQAMDKNSTQTFRQSR